MGVPSFYRWLVKKYPKIVVDAIEETGDAVDSSSPNPNQLEFDNLYLDMNGIIHPCFHPDDNLFPPTTFDEVFSNVYDYIDRLFNIVRPRKLLYLAIDGVAPRAKMNQQRSRRFRAAKDLQMAEEVEDKFRKEFEMEGKVLLPKKESQVSDSNVITPGTEFMYTLAMKLRSYIRQRISDSVAWRSIKVILSDASVPGEGEHKIMSYIRSQRSAPGYDPNIRHCLYGLDADLIMLALTTHEIHFSIIREDIRSAIENSAHEAETFILKSRGWFNRDPFQQTSFSDSHKSASQKEPVNSIDKCWKKTPYQFLHVWILREYLALDLEITSLPEKLSYDFERIIDDFILICCFAGNDFLPHMPSLEIHEGAIDLLMHVYKNEFKNLGGYLVDMQQVGDRHACYIKLKRVERFLITVGEKEDKIFEKRAQIRDKKLRRFLLEMTDAKDHETNSFRQDGRTSDFEGYVAVNEIEKNIIYNKKDCDKKYQKEDELASSVNLSDDQILKNTKELKQKMKDYIRSQSDLFKDGCFGTDKVKFGTAGWKERYYKEKFSVESPEEIEAMRKNVVTKYGEGLCWVLLYYFSGVPSWTWFYPYHYGPLASDFKGLQAQQTRVKFTKDSPFKPFDQLMGVFPPYSAHALPEAYQRLMINEDSLIIDFYPTEFETDVDGKRFLWQGVVKLPFIDEKRLLIESKKLEDELKDHEKIRNLQSLDLLFVASSEKLGNKIISCGRNLDSEANHTSINIDITEVGIAGTVCSVLADENNGVDLFKDVTCVLYENHHGLQHVPRLLEGVNIPEKIVDENDILETKLWHEERGNTASNFSRFHNQSRPGKQESNPESRPRTSYVPNVPNAIFKGAGSRFIGRDKTSMTTRECNSESLTRTSYIPNGPNAIIIGAGSGFIGRGKTTTSTLPVEGWSNLPEQGPRRVIGELTPTQYAPRVSMSSRSNTWGSRTRGHYPSDTNRATHNYYGRSNLGFGRAEECTSYIPNVPNAIIVGAGSGFIIGGKTTTSTLPVEGCSTEQSPRRVIGELAPTQYAPRVSMSSRSNTWGSRTRGHYSSDTNRATHNYNGRSKLVFGRDEEWRGKDISSSIGIPQQSGAPWGSRQRGYGQGSSSQIRKHNLSSSTYNTSYGPGRSEQVPETSYK